MKRILLILPLLLPLTGCIVYSPSPTSGQYGYTYDYSLPIAEGVPARIPERAVVATEVDPVSPPPRVPPIYSEIPEPSPDRPLPASATRTVIVPSAPIIQEAAGAQATTPVPPPFVSQEVAPTPPVAVAGGGFPFVIGTNTNTNGTNVTGVITNTNNTVGVITNTNNVGVITNTNSTGLAGTNNSPFGILPNPNINEAAGAQRTNQLDIPDRLPPAPRLSEPRPDPNANVSGEPVSSPTPTSPLPQQNPLPQEIQQQQQQQQPTAPAPQQPAPSQPSQPFAPVAPR